MPPPLPETSRHGIVQISTMTVPGVSVLFRLSLKLALQLVKQLWKHSSVPFVQKLLDNDQMFPGLR